jgi:hypothetical protein
MFCLAGYLQMDPPCKALPSVTAVIMSEGNEFLGFLEMSQVSFPGYFRFIDPVYGLPRSLPSPFRVSSPRCVSPWVVSHGSRCIVPSSLIVVIVYRSATIHWLHRHYCSIPCFRSLNPSQPIVFQKASAHGMGQDGPRRAG